MLDIYLLGSLCSHDGYAGQIKRHLKVNVCLIVTILRLLLLLAFFIVDKLRYRWTGRSAVTLNRETERFTVCVHVVVKAINLEISRCQLADYVKELY